MALISIYGTLYNVTGEAIVKVEQAYDSIVYDSELGALLGLQQDSSLDQHSINEAIAAAVNQGGGGGGVSIEVVQELPQTGESNVIYLVPKQTAAASNVFDEYIYTNNAWELIGTTEIDLSNYIEKSSTAGLVKNDGTIDETEYISQVKTINNQSIVGEGNITIESGGGTDADVTLSADLYTRYPVGKFTQAAANNPVKVGELGDSLRDVWNNIFQMEDEEATVTQPTISLAITSSASDERGTSFGTVSYAVTTTTGEYSFNNPTTNTGVEWSKYSITSNDATDIEDTTSATGTVTLNSNYVVGTSGTLTFGVSGTHGDGNYALTKFGEVSQVTRIVAATVSGADAAFSKAAVDYPYSTASASDTAPVTATKKSTSLLTTGGLTLDYTANQYLFVYIRKGSESSQPTKTIEIYSDLTKEWSAFLGGTVKKGSVTLTKANGTTDAFWAYMTQTTAASTDSAKMRLV